MTIVSRTAKSRPPASAIHRRLFFALTFVAVASVPTGAQTPQTPAPFGIVDNSFLVEEAFNQERGVVQNILSFTQAREGRWDLVFTQEWPVFGATHQFSYSIPVSRIDRQTGIGDTLFNYRFQVAVEGPGRPAFAPRVSVIVPTGDSTTGLGEGTVGWQVNLPFSKQRRNLYFHWNAGFSYLRGVDAATPGQESLFSPTAAGSIIWQVSSTLNVLFETLAQFSEEIRDNAATRHDSFTMSPGVRRAWNWTDKQIVVGAALPTTLSTDATRVAVLTYFSYEGRFKK